MVKSGDGVMGSQYAAGRREALHLQFRLQVRAQVAVGAARARLPPFKAWRVLDLGAADGLTLLHARSLLGGQGSYDGVERSLSLLAAAPQLPANVRLLVGNVTRLPAEIEPESYDLCMALAVLEHLADPLACVKEAARALAPGGVFVATCPEANWDHLAGALRMVADEHHAQRMTKRRMLNLVRDAGLVDEHFARFMWAPVAVLPYLNVPVPPRLSLWIDSLIRELPLARLACVNQVVVAQKVGRAR